MAGRGRFNVVTGSEITLMLNCLLAAAGGEVVVSTVDPASVRDYEPHVIVTEEEGKQVVTLTLVERGTGKKWGEV